MRSKPGPLLAAALVVALALPVCAQETGSEPADSPADAPSEPPPEAVAPHEMTCAEIRDTFLDEEHEEEASYLAAWAYGVRTGAKGLDFDKHPVTMAGLQEFVTSLTLACKANPDKLFVDAILE